MWPGAFLRKDQPEKLPTPSIPSSPVAQNSAPTKDDHNGQELVVSKNRRDGPAAVTAMPALNRPNYKNSDGDSSMTRSESLPTYIQTASPPSSISSSQQWSAQRPTTSSSHGLQSSVSSNSDYTNIVNLALQLNALRRNQSPLINAGPTSNVAPSIELGFVNPLLDNPAPNSQPTTIPQLQQASSNNSIHMRYSSLPITNQEQNAIDHNRRRTDTMHSAHDDFARFPISDSTAARVEKVREHFELFVEYMRLLPHLPPIRECHAGSDSDSDNASGGGHGREYNPLQYIRNRKVRFREKSAVDTQPSYFENVSHVSKWVDNIVANTPRKACSTTDCLDLPNIGDRPSPVSAIADPESQQIHEGNPSKASCPAGSTASDIKPRRPRFDWVFTPANLFADADWLEKDGNKLKIEDRDGNNIYHRSTKFNRIPLRGAPSTGKNQPLLVVDSSPLNDHHDNKWSTAENEDLNRSSSDLHSDRPHHWHGLSSSLHLWRDQHRRKHKRHKSKASRYESETDSDTILRSSPLAQRVKKAERDASDRSPASSSKNRENNETIHDSASGGARGRSRSSNRYHKHIPKIKGRRHRRSPSTSGSEIRKSSESGRDSLDSFSHIPPPQYPNITMDLSLPSSRAGSPIKNKKDFDYDFKTRSPSTGSRSNADEAALRGDLMRSSLLKGSKIADLGKEVTPNRDRYLSDKFSLSSYTSSDLSDGDNDDIVGLGGARLRRRSSKYLSVNPGNSTIPEESDHGLSSGSGARGNALHHEKEYDKTKEDGDAEVSSATPVAETGAEDSEAVLGGPDPPGPASTTSVSKPGGADGNGNETSQSDPSRQKPDTTSNTMQDISLKFVKSPDEVAHAEMLSLSHKRELDRVRALLVCSGIKASALIRQMDGIAEAPAHHFRDLKLPNEASLLASLRLPRRQQTAATMNALVSIYDTEVHDMQEPMKTFNDHTLPSIRASISKLQGFVNETLYPRIFDISTEADELSNDLSTTSTLAVKELHDILDQGQRIRRRRFRWISRPGYVVLEWFLIFAMWAVWFFVTIFRAVRGLWRIAVRCLKWVLWL